jgi:hypothetical protein
MSRRPDLVTLVTFYALASSDSDFAVDVFATRAAAEEAMRTIIEDEPLLSIVSIPPPWSKSGPLAFAASPQ